MKRRRVIVGAGVLALVGAVAWVIWLCQPRPCRATFEKVREGMTLVEVCATVGGEPGDYTDGRSLAYLASWIRTAPKRDDEERQVWAAGGAFLLVVFAHGRVKTFEIRDPSLTPQPPLPDRLRARLGI